MNMIRQPIQSTRFFAIFLSFWLTVALLVGNALAEVAIQQVKSPGGITAWLVEDYSVPIVTIRFTFDGGSAQDPAGKEGLAQLMSGLFDEGAGDLEAETFQERLDDAGAEMRFGASRDGISATVRMLADQRDDALDLVKLAIGSPRFDAAAVDRIRGQMIAGIVAGQRDPDTAAREQWSKALFGNHPYARPEDGTPETLASITQDDLRAFHRNVLARDNLDVAIVGAIDVETAGKVLDDLFGDLPEKANLQPVPDVDMKLDQQVAIDFDRPQTSLQLAYPGIGRHEPDFFAAYLMNHILGGGTFSSRLFKEVRDKRGLAYSVSSSLLNRDHTNGLMISTATRSDRADETLAIIRDEVRRMAEEGPTQEELDAAKKYVINSYALNNLDSSPSIAATLVSLQSEGLGIDYMQRRPALIEAVTLDDVKAVARKLLSAEPAVLVVGPPLTGSKGG